MRSWKSMAKSAMAVVLSTAMIATVAPTSYVGLKANADAASLQTAVDANLTIQESSIHKLLTKDATIALPTTISGVDGAVVEYSVEENPYVTIEGTTLKVVKQPYASLEDFNFNVKATVKASDGSTVTKDFPMTVRAGLADDDMAGYLYVCFADPATGGDVQQIHFFLSEDGLNWTAVNGCLPAYMVGSDYPTSDYFFEKDWKLNAISGDQTYDVTPKSVNNGAFYNEDDIADTKVGDASVLFPFEGRDHGLRDPYLIRGSLADGSDANTIRILATDLNIYCKQYGNQNWGRMTSSKESGDNYDTSKSGGSKQLFIFETKDLIHWERTTVDVGNEIGGGCAWAPEAIYNPEKDNYLVYWSCRVEEDGYARNRLYCNETRDFKNFGPTKLYEEEPFYKNYMEKYPNYPEGTTDNTSDGFGNIDTSQLWVADGENPYGTLYRLVKDETNNHIELMSAKTVLDPDVDYASSNPILKNTTDYPATTDGLTQSTKIAELQYNWFIDQSVGNHFVKIDQENMEKYSGAYEGATMFKFFDRDEWCIMIDYYGSSKVRYEPYVTYDLSEKNSVTKVASGYGRTGGDVGCHGGMIPITVKEYNEIINTYNDAVRYSEITGIADSDITTTKNISGYVYHEIDSIEVDKTELKDTISAMQEAVKDTKKYSASEISTLNSLISKGNSLVSNVQASSAEIDKVIASANGIINAVKLSKNSVSLVVGATATITSETKDLVWESADASIATVNNGVIKGIKAGKTTVTATNAKGITATVAVTVIAPSIKLSKSKVTLTVGSSKTVKATVVPATDSVTWTSSKTSVATVSKGKIVAKKAGSAVITAKSKSGKTAKVSVTVKVKDSLSVKAASSVKVKKAITLKATVKGSLKASNTKWSISKGSKNAKLSKTKGSSVKLTGKKKGTVVVKAVCGKLSKKVTIKVK